MVEVQKLRTFYDFCGPRATLCGDRARRSALAVAPCEFVGEPSAEIVRVKAALAVAPCNILARETAFGSSFVVCAPAFGRGFDSPLVRGSSGLKIAAIKYKRSTRSVLLQLRLENRNF